MGVCLSCLRGDVDDDEFNERTSLLHSNQFLDENVQEEILKQQQRHAELNAIVNDLSDNLIDVTTFFQNSNGTPEDTKSKKSRILDEVAHLGEDVRANSKIVLSGPLFLELS